MARFNLTEGRHCFCTRIMRCMKYIFFIAGLLVLVASFAGGDEPKEKRMVATVDPDGIQRVDVLGGEYYFDPNVIVVKVNIPVELKARKAGGFTPHNIALKAPEAGIDFNESISSDPKVIKFTPTKAGKYSFECTHQLLFFKSHKDRGMHGVLEVVE